MFGLYYRLRYGSWNPIQPFCPSFYFRLWWRSLGDGQCATPWPYIERRTGVVRLRVCKCGNRGLVHDVVEPLNHLLTWYRATADTNSGTVDVVSVPPCGERWWEAVWDDRDEFDRFCRWLELPETAPLRHGAVTKPIDLNSFTEG